MRIDDLDYTRLVSGTYKKMRSENKLSSLLAKPTRSNIRRECLYVFDTRYRPKDNSILRGFFGPADSRQGYLSKIEGSGAEQFRTLNNYLKEETERTEHANIELLAWLLDFKHRPWSLGMDVKLSEEEISILYATGGDDVVPQLGPLIQKGIPVVPTPIPLPLPIDELPEVTSPVDTPEEVPVEIAPENGEKPGVKLPPPTRTLWPAIFLILMIFTTGALILSKQFPLVKEETGGSLPDDRWGKQERQFVLKEKKDSAVEGEIVKTATQREVIKKATVASIALRSVAGSCRGVTKKGTPCKRKAGDNGYCWQHAL